MEENTFGENMVRGIGKVFLGGEVVETNNGHSMYCEILVQRINKICGSLDVDAYNQYVCNLLELNISPQDTETIRALIKEKFSNLVSPFELLVFQEKFQEDYLDILRSEKVIVKLGGLAAALGGKVENVDKALLSFIINSLDLEFLVYLKALETITACWVGFNGTTWLNNLRR